MKRTLRLSPAAVWLACATVCAFAAPASAQIIVNGGFESGFTGWTVANQVGSDGTFFLQSGTASPVNGDPVPAPPEGTTAAMTDAQGPGSHVLYQDFVVGTTAFASANLSFSLFIGNRADAFSTPATLDFSTPALNQQARVDILRAGTDPFSVAGADVLLNAFQTQPGDPLVSGYTAHTVDLAGILNANLGQTLRLRFAEVDNVFTFQLGVDAVGLSTQAVPEPSFVVAGLAPLLGIAWRLRRK
jgi:hypothetical protein